MWRHLLHYPIIKKSVFAQEQLVIVIKPELEYAQQDDWHLL